MKAMYAALLVVLLTGCVSTAPEWESRFGEASRQARAAQVINPDAPRRNTGLGLTDGKAVAGSMTGYAKSYGYAVEEARPPALTITTNGGR